MFHFFVAIKLAISSPKHSSVEMLMLMFTFLGPRGPLVLPLIGPVRPVRPVRAKNLDHLYTGIYAL